MRIAVVAPSANSEATGGAERLYDGLVGALNESDCEAQLVQVASDESSFETIQEAYLRCYELDVSAFDAVISTKAPTYLVQHPNHICYLVHTIRVFYDMIDEAFPIRSDKVLLQREQITKLDNAALSPRRLRNLYCIGHEVAERLAIHNGLKARVLHPGSALACRPGPFGNYILVPGRLHRWKRVGLLIDAFKLTTSDLRLVICGDGEEAASLRAQAGGDQRIEFLGRVADSRLIDLYSGALAVAFVPIREDFGYVALEASLSGKPVITCKDSGEPARLLNHGVTGLVCDPKPRALAEAMKLLANHRGAAEAMGQLAKLEAAKISWASVGATLLGDLSAEF